MPTCSYCDHDIAYDATKCLHCGAKRPSGGWITSPVSSSDFLFGEQGKIIGAVLGGLGGLWLGSWLGGARIVLAVIGAVVGGVIGMCAAELFIMGVTVVVVGAFTVGMLALIGYSLGK